MRALAVLLFVTPTLFSQVAATEAGQVSGTASSGVRSWKGIPYARPPVGDLRWRPPQPHEPWSGVRAATQFGSLCPQGNPASPQPEMSEDCLTLNVWSAAQAGDKLPVIFWIHGGGFVGGSGRMAGEPLAQLGAVVVSINYRLGVLGFLAHPDLSAESGHRASGNYGLLDQIAALQWVRKNIAAFGGDPGRVCIGGGSAGGTSVGYLMASPLAKGLFQRAMLDSASRLFLPDPALRQRVHGLTPMEQVGLELGGSIKDLRALDTLDLMKRAMAMTERFYADDGPGRIGLKPESHIHLPRAHDNPWWAFTDGYVMPKELRDMYSSPDFHPVPALVATSADEGLGFSKMEGWNVAQYRAYLQARYPAIGPELWKMYPAGDPEGVRPAVSRIITDFMFLYGSIEVARAVTAHGGSAYVSRFTRVPPGAPGAMHVADGPYYQGTVKAGDRFFQPADVELKEQMARRFAAFAKTGNPNAESIEPQWPAWDAAHPRYIDFGDEVRIRDFKDEKKMRAFATTLRAR